MIEEKLLHIYNNIGKEKNYGLSKHWLTNSANKSITKGSLSTFRQNLSYGLDDKWKSKTNDELISNVLNEVPFEFMYRAFFKENIGNALNVIEIKNRYTTKNELVQIHYAYTLIEAVKNNIDNNMHVLEIGAGFGALCRILKYSINIPSYTIIETLENSILTAYYLSLTTDASVFLNGEEISSKNNLQVINIFTSNIKETYIDSKYDIVINARSMMEMTNHIVAEYFDLIHKNCKIGGYFLNINRYSKRSSGEDVEIGKYPYDDFWSCIESRKSFQQEHMHYLLSRREKSASDIKYELLKISKYTIEYKKNVSTLLARFINMLPNVISSFLKQIKFLYDKRKK